MFFAAVVNYRKDITGFTNFKGCIWSPGHPPRFLFLHPLTGSRPDYSPQATNMQGRWKVKQEISCHLSLYNQSHMQTQLFCFTLWWSSVSVINYIAQSWQLVSCRLMDGTVIASHCTSVKSSVRKCNSFPSHQDQSFNMRLQKYLNCLIYKQERKREVSKFCGWSEPRRCLTGPFSKEWEIRETCLMILWPSWQFYSGRVWKLHRKEVQKTEHNPKKTQQNTISRDNKRGKGDGVGRRGDSMEMLSFPDSKLTVLWREKGEEKKGGRDKWGGGGEPGVPKEAKQDPSPVEKQETEKMLNWREK